MSFFYAGSIDITWGGGHYFGAFGAESIFLFGTENNNIKIINIIIIRKSSLERRLQWYLRKDCSVWGLPPRWVYPPPPGQP
ncbi:MAG: hypothetical protein PHF72_13050, partial [Gammaproteobacteria bacterium]|nr:hypothetical protein [Gammaproteobacteria bacterium]